MKLFSRASDVGCDGVASIGLSAIATGLAIKLPPSLVLLLHINDGEMVEFIMMSDSIVGLLTGGSTVSIEFGDELIVGIGCWLSITSVDSGDGFVGLVVKIFGEMLVDAFGKLSI